MSGRLMVDGETTAGRKRIFFCIFQETTPTAPWAGSVTGVKAQLSTNGGTEAASTNDIVRVGGSLHYVELTDAEAAAAAPGDRVWARVAASGGARLEALGYADVLGGDWYSAAATTTEVADAVLKRDFAAVTGAAARSLLNANRLNRNKWVVSGNTLTVYAEDDTTVAWTATITGITASSSDPA